MPVSKLGDKFKYILSLLIFIGIYFVAAKIGLSLSIGVEQVTLVWPPTGIAIAVLILYGKKAWPAVLIGAFLTNITTNETVPVALMVAIGNTLEVLVAKYLLDKVSFNKSFNTVLDVVKFMFLGAIIPSIISAAIGTSTLFFGGNIGLNMYTITFVTWVLGDAIGAIIFAPIILSFKDIKVFPFKPYKIIELFLLFSSTIIVSTLIFTNYFSSDISKYSTRHLVYPFIIWSALRFGIPGAAWTTFLISTISLIGLHAGGGPFFNLGSPETGLILLQSLMAVLAISTELLASSITEKDTAEQIVTGHEKRFQSLIEHSYEALVLLSPSGNITYASPSTEKILGYSQGELLNKNGFDFVDPDDKNRLIKNFANLIIKPNEVVKVETRVVTKSGVVRHAEATAKNLLNDPDVSAVVINFHDVTEDRKLEESKSQFVSLAAHELRSPLSNVRWYSESAMKEKTKNTKLSEYITQIYTSAIRMTSIVNMLLNVSKVELGKLAQTPEEIDLMQLIKNSVDSFKPNMKLKKIKLTEKYQDIAVPAYIDPNLVRIIIDNIIQNAIKYSKTNGKISVTAEKTRDLIHVEISDSGIGIPSSQKDKIFTKLFRADNVKKEYPDGTGLGLYLSKEISRKLNGDISFESETGKGTKFLIDLPVHFKNTI